MLLWLTQTALAAEAPAKPDVAMPKLNYVPLLHPHPWHPRFPKASPLLGGVHPFQKPTMGLPLVFPMVYVGLPKLLVGLVLWGRLCLLCPNASPARDVCPSLPQLSGL